MQCFCQFTGYLLNPGCLEAETLCPVVRVHRQKRIEICRSGTYVQRAFFHRSSTQHYIIMLGLLGARKYDTTDGAVVNKIYTGYALPTYTLGC